MQNYPNELWKRDKHAGDGSDRLKPNATLHSPLSVVAELVSELSSALVDDPLIDELAFLPSAGPSDVFGESFPLGGIVTSTAVPGAFLLVRHKLAIAINALVPVYTYISAAHRRACNHQNENDGGLASPGIDPMTGLDTYRLLLLINGELNTAWNGLRRRMMQNFAGLGLKARRCVAICELRFAQVVISGNPKATACWVYRRWILKNLSVSPAKGVTGLQIEHVLANEITMVERATRFRRFNYAAWTHLRCCSQDFFAETKRLLPQALLANLTENLTSYKWRNLVDKCLIEYLRMLSDKLLSPECRTISTLITKVIEVYTEREATWTYHRYLSGALANSLSQRLDMSFKTFKNVEQRLTPNEDLHFLYRLLTKKDEVQCELVQEISGWEPLYFTALYAFWSSERSRRLLMHPALGMYATGMAVTLKIKRTADIVNLARFWTWNPAAILGFFEA